MVLGALAAGVVALLVLAVLSGAFMTPLALIGAIYVVFLGFAFHGPSHWAANQAEFGAFMSHFPFAAGLLYAAVHGPGIVLSVRQGWPGRA